MNDILKDKYNASFNQPTIKLTENLLNQFKDSDKKILLFIFLLSTLCAFSLVYWNNFFVNLIGQSNIALSYIFTVIMLVSIVFLVTDYYLPFNSKLVKIVNPSLFSQYNRHQQEIDSFFTDEQNIKEMISYMDYLKSEFAVTFVKPAGRVSVRNVEMELLEAVRKRNIKEVIVLYFEIKSDIDSLLLKGNLKSKFA